MAAMNKAVVADEARLAKALLVNLLELGGLSAALAGRATFVGAGDIYPTPFRLGATMAAAVAAIRLAADSLEGRTLPFAVDLAVAAASTSSFRYVRLNGAPTASPRDVLTGFYAAADGQPVFLHLNFPHHRARAFATLGLRDPDRAAIGRAVAVWPSDQLDERLNAAGACATITRDRMAWRASSSFAALSSRPLVTIDKIADSEPHSRKSRALAELRVVDFTRVLAGPTCGRVLAEGGASVLRVNNPRLGDLPAYELDANRLKRQVTLDLDAPADREQLLADIEVADVFLQAYRPGAVARYGLSAEALALRRRGLIYVSLSAYGEADGRRGFDSVLQAAAGLALEQGQGVPALLPTSPIDYLSGFLLAYGALVALGRRAREGGSYVVRTSLAQVAEWLAALPPTPRALDEMPSNAFIDGLMQQTTTAAGIVVHLRSPITWL